MNTLDTEAQRLHGHSTVPDLARLQTREIHWMWQERPITLGIDEAGQGKPVLFLPALSSISTRREMRPLMERLASAYHTITSDWPGFGDRPRPAVAWTPEALSAFLNHLVTAELPPLHATVAAGHAATYALHLVAQNPGVIGRLILLAPTWRGPLPTMAGGDRPVFHRIRTAIGLPVIGPLLYRMNVNRVVVRMMAAGHVYSDKRAFSGERRRQKEQVIAAAGARFGSVAFVTGGLDRVASRAELLILAECANVPILLGYGADTPIKSRAEMEALAALPQVRTIVLPRGKLAFHEEFPEDLVTALLAFLAS